MLDRTHTHVADAERRRDPTGTGDIRSRFRSDMRQRWTRMRRLVREAVVDHDMLGLGPTSVESISTVAQGGDVIRGFQMWLDEALKQVVLGGDGSWTRPYVQETAARAEARAHRLVGWQGASATHYSADALQAAVVVELQGVAEAVSQQVMRVAASAVLAKVKPTVAARQALDRIEAVGKTRARMVAETSIVQAFNHATLDVFQALGLRKVGTQAETMAGPVVTGRDAWDPDQPRAPAGSPEGGQWTSGEGGGGGSVKGLPETVNIKDPALHEALKRGAFEITATPGRNEGFNLIVSAKQEGGAIPFKAREGDSYSHLYNPDLAELKREDVGTAIERTRAALRPGIEEDIAPLPGDYIYRGISHEEYQDIVRRGFVQSKGEYNIGEAQRGLTYWTEKPDTAAYYASGFQPWQATPTFGRPAYVIAARRPSAEHIRNVPGTGEGEVGVAQAIRRSDLVAVWRGDVAYHQPGRMELRRQGYSGSDYAIGSRSSPSSRVVWRRVAMQDAYNPDQPRAPAGSPEGGQWTSGEGGGGGTAEAEKPSPMSHAQHVAIADRVTASLAFPRERVTIGQGQSFVLNGKEMQSGGHFDPRTGEVVLAATWTDAIRAEAALAHEIMHAKYEKLLQDANAEPPVQFAHTIKQEMQKDVQGFISEDGISPYSTEYWRSAYRETTPAGASQAAVLAINETLAEISRLHWIEERYGLQVRGWPGYSEIMQTRPTLARTYARINGYWDFAQKERRRRLKTDAADAKQDEELYEVLTAGDDLVCQVCEDISADGPYDLEEARGLIPAHPNCRCAFVPFFDERFAPVERDDGGPQRPRERLARGQFEEGDAAIDFDPDQPRDDHGRWTEGGGGATATASEFKEVSSKAFIEARNISSRAGFLSPLKPEDLAHHTAFMTPDGKAGAALDSHGDIQNVFNNGGPKGAGQRALVEAISRGGRTLDCYDGYLPKLYSQFGFVETGRMKFNPDYAPSGWDHAKYDSPDVVFMAWKGYMSGGADAALRRGASQSGGVNHKVTDVYESDWDKAKAASRAAAKPRGAKNS